jgi:ribonuclease P protein component
MPNFSFKKIYRQGKTRQGEFLNLKYLENGLSFPRFGFVVSSKIIAKANKRNLIRRRAKEIIRVLMPKIRPGFDFILIFKKEANFKELDQELKRLFSV